MMKLLREGTWRLFVIEGIGGHAQHGKNWPKFYPFDGTSVSPIPFREYQRQVEGHPRFLVRVETLAQMKDERTTNATMQTIVTNIEKMDELINRVIMRHGLAQ